MRLKILGKIWQLRFVPTLGDGKGGDCDPPSAKSKTIRVLSNLKGEKRLEIIIHEMLHAADWHRSEEWVSETASDIARALTRLGYRKGDE